MPSLFSIQQTKTFKKPSNYQVSMCDVTKEIFLSARCLRQKNNEPRKQKNIHHRRQSNLDENTAGFDIAYRFQHRRYERVSPLRCLHDKTQQWCVLRIMRQTTASSSRPLKFFHTAKKFTMHRATIRSRHHAKAVKRWWISVRTKNDLYRFHDFNSMNESREFILCRRDSPKSNSKPYCVLHSENMYSEETKSKCNFDFQIYSAFHFNVFLLPMRFSFSEIEFFVGISGGNGRLEYRSHYFPLKGFPKNFLFLLKVDVMEASIAKHLKFC